ncbi:nucleoside diphosphate kinase 3 isoform X2 [Calypte anna]|uniref:nucleoside diphosphate kinase 3 isoform X2 n=1 Tax=Calypte anna TaxID=9244 RepID=UPI0011C4939C|nr:nucleoside diphosphate kinase 3 isoform X2 [Calypte anna]
MGTGPPSLGPAAPQAPLDRSAAGGCRSGPQRGRRGRSPFKSRAAMICLVLGLFAGLFQTACSGAGERTFVAIKPDGVQRHLVGEIIRRFERKGLQLVGLKLLQASEELLREHYIALRDRPFYSRLVQYMSSGPVVAMVWQGLDVVKTVRTMIGETNPAESLPGTIRGDFCVEVSKNVIHGSDSAESAGQEISLWFRPEELICWDDTAEHWLYA